MPPLNYQLEPPSRVDFPFRACSDLLGVRRWVTCLCLGFLSCKMGVSSFTCRHRGLKELKLKTKGMKSVLPVSLLFFLCIFFGLLFLPSATLFISSLHTCIFFFLLKRRRFPGPIRILERRSGRGPNPTPSARGGTRSGATTRCSPFFSGDFRPGLCSTDESPGHPLPTRPGRAPGALPTFTTGSR